MIGVRRADSRLFISLYGEVQKDVIEATQSDDFGLKVAFEETTTICAERHLGTGEPAEFTGVPPGPFLAGVGLRVAPFRVTEKGSSAGCLARRATHPRPAGPPPAASPVSVPQPRAPSACPNARTGSP